MKDIAVKVDGTTTLPAVKFNSMVDELENSIVDTGQTLEGAISTDKQIQIAMATYASGSDFYTDSGSANAYALNVVGSKQSPHAYFDGMIARFRPTNANSGASTVNINSLGALPIVYQDGTTALAGGSLVTTHDALIRYSASVGKFILLNNNINDLLDVNTTGAVDGSILQRNAGGIWVVASGSASPTNSISGLICENASGDTAHDITLNTGKCRDFADTINISVGSAITKQIDANWADGTNNGGFPSSITLTTDTWYHFFAIAKPDGSSNAGFDSSLTATNLLDGSNAGGAGYTKYRRVASVLTDGSGNIINGVWKEIAGGGVKFIYGTKFTNTFSNNASYTDFAVETPLGIVATVILNTNLTANISVSVDSIFYLLSKLTAEEILIGSGASSTGSAPFSPRQKVELETDTSSNIQLKTDNANSFTIREIFTLGYIDNRLN